MDFDKLKKCLKRIASAKEYLVREKISTEKGKEDGVSEDEVKEYQDDVQKSTDAYVKKIDDVVSAKSDEIMTV